MRWRTAKRAIDRSDALGSRPARRGGRAAAALARVRAWQMRRWRALLASAAGMTTMTMNPALDYLRKLDQAAAFRALARCLHAHVAELDAAEACPLAHQRQGEAYTLENRARGIEIRLGLPVG